MGDTTTTTNYLEPASGENLQYTNNENITSKTWETELMSFEIVHLCITGITAWVLLCMIVYGTKTRRWTNTAGSSSLNSGPIYIACTVAVALTLPRLITTELMFHVKKFGDEYCELMGDIGTGSYGLSLYSMYFFLCLRQRLIYTHPCVKDNVSKCMDWFSKIFFFILTAVTVALSCLFMIPENYSMKSYGCNENRDDSTSILLACSYLITQGMLLVLCIYPAYRVSIKSVKDSRTSLSELGSTNSKLEKNETDGSLCGCCRFLFSCVATSPVEMTIRRTIIYSILVVISDIIAVIVETLTFPVDSPTAIRLSVLDMGSFFNIFFLLATFGFARHVLTIFFPACPNMKCKSSNGDMSSIESTEDGQV